MDKVLASPEEAVADIADGSSVAVGGFGLSHRFPSSLIVALRDRGSKDLCVVCNGLGQPGYPTAHLLAENHQVSTLIASFSARPGAVSEAERQITAGELAVEMVPQGTLVERMRAGGAGIAAFYTPTGVGTDVAAGKEIRDFGGRPHVLESAIRVDYTLLRGFRADRMGNVQMRGGSRNFNVSFAKAARVAIVEVEEIVEVGELSPESIDLPGIFVSRVVATTISMDVHSLPRRVSRGANSARSYNSKEALTRAQVAERAANLLEEGSYVNLGTGIPTLVSNFLGGRDVVLHSENGILGYGGFVEGEDIDPDVHDAGGWFVSLNPGAAFFESVTSFEMARSGRLGAVILGGYQVGARGDLANWITPERVGGGIGGAMDLAAGARRLIVTMEHCDSRGRPKLVNACSYPLTAPERVDVVVTDLALLERGSGAFRLLEVAAGFSVEEVVALTEMPVEVTGRVGTMQDALSG
ncbi:MAG: 3-oxoacid CoA-transferase [Acidimicrobiales bacterium]